MQVNATASERVPAVRVSLRPGDFESFGPAVVELSPVLGLTTEELSTALLMADLSTEALRAMGDAEVRQWTVFVLIADGLSAVQDTVRHERTVGRRDVDVQRHIALCRVRVISAFGLVVADESVPVVKRSRIGDAIARQRRIVVRAA